MKQEQAQNSNKAKHNWEGKTFLIADDYDISYQLIEEMIERTGAKILRAYDGEEVVKLYEEHANDIDVILMDLEMPKQNGFIAAEKIRAMNADIPIIAQSAIGLEGSEKRSLDAGCNEYISKPVSTRKFMATITKYIP